MAKRKSEPKITDLPEPPKHHEMQAIKNVAYIRKAVTFLTASVLRNIRQKLSMTDGNGEFVERLRGKSGDDILARVAQFIMLEIGDSATSLEPERGVVRDINRSVRGQMGLATEDEDEAETA